MRSSSARTWQTVVLALIIIGLIALALGGYLSPVTRVVMAPVISAQTWLSTRYITIQNYFRSPQDLVRLRQRNLELEAENARLETQIIELEQQLSETRILSALVDFARVHPQNRYVAASVIGRDPSPFVKYVIINRGSDDGLRRGMPVVTSQGLVGRVAAVTAGAGRVELITDPASSINVRLEPSGAQAVLLGSITGELALDFIPQSVSVQAGDLVLTSGLGGNYPGNILIGQITNVRRRETDLFQSATVQPVVDFSRLEILLIITNFQPVDISPLIPTPGAP
ncbi:MAG: rod shape-determining protein MreC [Anaerolineae bacterium UTCFX2]|jgi:rod shape-determining protein MreC|nr:rod shape-determining protein MreC [Anaerolineales bacterium]OQY90925.1 MAG: rod shape-determining protein MreC [Anaerolineae bacterium UTCFX2]